MTRLTIDDLTGDMPEQTLIAALDDDRDGFADEKAFRAALASANARAEAIFGGAVPPQYATAVDYAVRVFLLDLLYRRHGDDAPQPGIGEGGVYPPQEGPQQPGHQQGEDEREQQIQQIAEHQIDDARDDRPIGHRGEETLPLAHLIHRHTPFLSLSYR